LLAPFELQWLLPEVCPQGTAPLFRKSIRGQPDAIVGIGKLAILAGKDHLTVSFDFEEVKGCRAPLALKRYPGCFYDIFTVNFTKVVEFQS
jgi:hypothetical protein